MNLLLVLLSMKISNHHFTLFKFYNINKNNNINSKLNWIYEMRFGVNETKMMRI